MAVNLKKTIQKNQTLFQTAKSAKLAACNLKDAVLDAADSTFFSHDEIPPRKLRRWSGGGNFVAVGELSLRQFITLADLKPNETVLDVGCGAGRIAVALTNYLNDGEYYGFDLHKKCVAWCQNHITPKFPNFHFKFADIYYKYCNPNGKYKASTFKFPYSDEMFDFVFATSTFTHILPNNVTNYFSEISRVLKANGRFFSTFFILNPESLVAIASGKSTFHFHSCTSVFSIEEPRIPELAIAYQEKFIKSLYKTNRINIEQIFYGSWSGREKALGLQDIIIGQKTRTPEIITHWTSPPKLGRELQNTRPQLQKNLREFRDKPARVNETQHTSEEPALFH